MATEAPLGTVDESANPTATIPSAIPPEPQKSIHTLILDSTPLILSVPPLSVLRSHSHRLLTTPAVVAELRDPQTRARFETLCRSFVDVRAPKRESVEIVKEFARKTGDLGVLSSTDLGLLGLCWEVDVEVNGGESKVRREPREKVGVAGVQKDGRSKRGKSGQRTADNQRRGSDKEQLGKVRTQKEDTAGNVEPEKGAENKEPTSSSNEQHQTETTALPTIEQLTIKDEPKSENVPTDTMEHSLQSQNPQTLPANDATDESPQDLLSSSTVAASKDGSESSSSSDDGGGWITPSNLSRHQAKDHKGPLGSAISSLDASNPLSVALITQDFAMQNVALQINLTILSSNPSSSLSSPSSQSLYRINHVKSFTLRCHACFYVIRPKHDPYAPPGHKKDDLSTKQFCPRCGGATLTRITFSIDPRTGEFKVHLKKNFQWNTRGQRYSVPKAVAGSASGSAGPGKQGAKGQGGKRKKAGGGKNGWGQSLIFAEDQKEYTRARDHMDRLGRRKEKDLMDGDALPGILSGDRSNAFGAGGKPKIGIGRNVNGTRRR
ncbi:MAG: Nin1 binding protein [Alyxoria varia]|nr:MAG: Nin1 binding protein [Alyxoria varia]